MQDDALRVDAELVGVPAEVLDRRLHVGLGLRVDRRRRVVVEDEVVRRQRDVAGVRVQLLPGALLAAIAEKAAAAVHEHDRGAVVERRDAQVAEHLPRPRRRDHDRAPSRRSDARGGLLDAVPTGRVAGLARRAGIV